MPLGFLFYPNPQPAFRSGGRLPDANVPALRQENQKMRSIVP